MRIIFSKNAWEDYISWQTEDKKTLKKINNLIKDIQISPYEGIGKPEPLKFDLAGLWSRRIDLEHRLVYKIEGDDLLIYACRYHYDKKVNKLVMVFAFAPAVLTVL
jgi:toxin YoeB